MRRVPSRWTRLRLSERSRRRYLSPGGALVAISVVTVMAGLIWDVSRPSSAPSARHEATTSATGPAAKADLLVPPADGEGDCTMLRLQFTAALQASAAAEPGSRAEHVAFARAVAVDDRMTAAGCQPPTP